MIDKIIQFPKSHQSGPVLSGMNYSPRGIRESYDCLLANLGPIYSHMKLSPTKAQ